VEMLHPVNHAHSSGRDAPDYPVPPIDDPTEPGIAPVWSVNALDAHRRAALAAKTQPFREG
jgi:hypothetical protein